MKLASFFLEVGVHLLLLITIVLITTRRDLAAVAGDARQRCVPYTKPMIVLVTSQCQSVLRSGPPARRRAVSGRTVSLVGRIER
jgi:hypothetical protein